MPFGPTHHIILNLARWSVWSFYSEVKVIGEENVPREGPIIFACNHSNMIVDPAVLAITIPHGRLLHFWAKNSLFKNKILRAILNDSGVVPVDRTSKNNQILFSASFKALKQGECLAVFPEGTSYTQPKLLEMKDGASWAALEYEKNLKDTEGGGGGSGPSDVYVVPVGICYLNKSKYRSSIVVTYAKPLKGSDYKEKFFVDPKPEIKKMTKAIQKGIESGTVNADTWDIWNAAAVSRMLLFNHDKGVELEHYVEVTQTLVDIFSDLPSKDESLTDLITLLNQYKTGLDATGLSSLDIARYNPNHLSRRSTMLNLFRETFGLLIRLPFFLPVLIFHWPAYVVGRYAVRGTIYEENFAQNKIMFNLLLLLIMYTVLFFATWIAFFLNPLGVFIAFGFTLIFAVYHVSQIDENYDRAKALVRSWKLVLWIGLSNAAGGGPWAEGRKRVEALVGTREGCLGGLRDMLQKHAEDDHIKKLQTYIELMESSRGRW